MRSNISLDARLNARHCSHAEPFLVVDSRIGEEIRLAVVLTLYMNNFECK